MNNLIAAGLRGRVVRDSRHRRRFHRRDVRALEGLFAHEPRVRAFTRPNGGKAAALNFGLRQTDAEIVVAIDADTIFETDTVARLAAHFTDSRIAAVAGNAKVGNRVNLLTRWQALE